MRSRTTVDARATPLSRAALQTKLAINEPGDAYEQQADRIADEIVSGQNSGHARFGRATAVPLTSPGHSAPDLAPDGSVAHSVETVLRSGAGRPLDAETRVFMESRFGHDFSRVRVHADPAAAESAHFIGARAYTTGFDVVFGSGQYAPASAQGRRLLAHELAHVVQQSGLPGPGLAVGSRSPAHVVRRDAQPSSAAARGAALDAIDSWETAGDAAMGRYRNWLTHNMSKFLADVLAAGKGSEGIENIKAPFAKEVLEHIVGTAGARAVFKVGEHLGAEEFAEWFLAARTAARLGGILEFFIGAIIEALIGDLLGQTNEIIHATAEQADKLVTRVVNPIVDAKQAEMRRRMQQLRNSLRDQALADNEWRRVVDDAAQSITQVNQLFLDTDSESLYRQLALQAGVYSARSVPAEEKPPIAAGVEQDFRFTMEHRLVKTGNTAISVTKDRGTILIRSRGYDCAVDETGTGPVDIKNPEAPPAYKQSPPPREYNLQLYQSGFVRDSDIGIPRVFHVGKEETAVWYNLAKGTYYLEAWRDDDHPVALCAEGKYSAPADSP
ncbi:MAG: DUF4157 domain-containing protein [Steroidobacteraceae bacterium]